MSHSPDLARRSLTVAGLLALVAAGTNLPVPLVLLYRDYFDLSTSAAAALFGVYAAGLIPAVLLAGPLSDRVGPLRVVLAGGVGSVAVSVGFALAHDTLWALFVVRLAQGVAAGSVFSVGSAWIQRIWVSDSGRGARWSAVSVTGGFAVGSLIGGVWGQWLARPLLTPFVLHAAGCLVAVLVVCTIADDHATAVRRAGPLLRDGARRQALLVVAPPALFVFGFPATAINAVPLMATFPGAPVAFTGVLAALTLGTGAVVAPSQRRLREATVPVAGLLGAVGMLAVAVAVAIPAAFPVVVLGCIALGAGGGLALSGGLDRVAGIARPGRAGAVIAIFYALAYAGFAVPMVVSELPVPAEWSFVVLALLCWVVWHQQRPQGSGMSETAGSAARATPEPDPLGRGRS